MKLKALVAIFGLACAFGVRADSYPSRPITFVVPSPPGGAVDVLARALANVMSQRMGQPIIVDNKPGASGVVATQMVARAAPDGYTLLVTHSGPILTAPYIFPKVPYDVKRDLTFVTQICTGQLVLAVNADKVPARNVSDFLAWARQQGGRVSYGSYGVGTAPHLMAAYLASSRKTDMVHVPYKGESAMVQDLIGGQIDWGIASLGTLAPQLSSGKLRALAILGDRRPTELPNVPTMAEAGFPEREFWPVGWAAMLAPPRMPPAILARIEKEARHAVNTTTMKARFQAYGMYAIGSSPDEFRRDVEATAPVMERLVRLSGARAD
ncbi:conserved exported hypothetical protein [Cupriavidus necator]|uniref:Extra-cytoplasmic solute receptor n=1 Tax=Cupriavidus necator TaxID=106590 RepID=A0A1K0IPV4_CUPNE|nr:conserved exported hypothetical protein [Cupriavidus necator]